MSTDFEVVTSQRPEKAIFETFLHDNKLSKASFNQDSLFIQIDSLGINVDGPFSVEPEDLADIVNSSAIAPRWCVQIHVPSEPKLIKMAKKLGTHIAENAFGVVYDPQSDKIIWPSKKIPRISYSSQPKERIDIVEFDIFLPFSPVHPGQSSRLLNILRKYCPEALPTRFGTFEPLQYRLQPGFDTPFNDLWLETERTEYGGSIDWDAVKPCFGGNVFFSDRREPPPGLTRRHRIGVTFDGRACTSNPLWTTAIIALFEKLAVEMDAFYAAAFVERDVIATRNNLTFDNKSENYKLQQCRWWLGIPRQPTWLAWFGQPYKAILESELVELDAARIKASGILLCMNKDKPLNRTELLPIFPKLPAAMLQSEYIDRPADFVPKLDRD